MRIIDDNFLYDMTPIVVEELGAWAKDRALFVPMDRTYMHEALQILSPQVDIKFTYDARDMFLTCYVRKPELEGGLTQLNELCRKNGCEIEDYGPAILDDEVLRKTLTTFCSWIQKNVRP